KVQSRDPGSQPGQLMGRRLNGNEWSDTAIMHRGQVDYRVQTEARAENGRVTMAARSTDNHYTTFSLDLSQGRPPDPDSYTWSEWRPVKLPLHPAEARRSIELDGKRYFLYWSDLHVHSRLTGDAEGEIDELMTMARDKSQLDVVAFTENANNTWM